MFGRLRNTVNLGKVPWLTIGQKIASTLVPPRCVLCGGPGQVGNELWGLDLCRHCESACQRHFACHGGSTVGMTAPAPAPDDHSFGGLDAVHALFVYDDPVDRLITGLKFRGELASGRVLGTLLARHLAALDLRLPQALVPMPLHMARHRERGFNQAEAIATHVARRTGVPIDSSSLQRTRATAPQTTLGAIERRRNCAGAFAVRPGHRVPRRVALIDDVMTTGSTAAAAADALRAAGARQVQLWVCAVALRGDAAWPGDQGW